MRVIIEEVLGAIMFHKRIYSPWGMEDVLHKTVLTLRSEKWVWLSKIPFILFLYWGFSWGCIQNIKAEFILLLAKHV